MFFFKWPPVAILDVQVQKSLLTISDQYHNLNFCDFFYKIAAVGHFRCPKHASLARLLPETMAFLAISDQYKTFCLILFFLQNDLRVQKQTPRRRIRIVRRHRKCLHRMSLTGRQYPTVSFGLQDLEMSVRDRQDDHLAGRSIGRTQ